MGMDYKQCVAFLRKYASPAELRDLMRTAATTFSYKHTRIFLTYYSMPDWLAITDTAAVPGAAVPGAEPFGDVLRAMSVESARPAVGAFIIDNSLESSVRKGAFRHLVEAYKSAAKEHQKSVADCLNCFIGLGSGRALLMELGRTRHTITVMPHWHYFMTMPGGHGFYNAITLALLPGQRLFHVTDGVRNNLKDSFAKGVPLRGEDEVLVGGTGTGAGANAIIFFSAGTFTDTVYTGVSTNEPADEVLFHELAHATRTIRGIETHIPVEGRPNFGNIEEYFATVITNIYTSEKGKDDRLRGVYAPGKANPPKDWSVMQDPDSFYDNVDKVSIPPDDMMDMFKRTQPHFYQALAHLPTPPRFNPARIHFKQACLI
jgi:hypothetical protein